MTIEGVTYPLPEPFLVIATQNPAEQIGTFPLPESQLDRFLMTTGIGYPPAELEKQIIRHGSIRDELTSIKPQIQREELLNTIKFIKSEIILGDLVVDYIHTLIDKSRSHPHIDAGLSTRGGLNLAAAAKVEAYLHGRAYVIPEDVQHIAIPVASHRLALNPEYQTISKEEVFRSLLADIPVPMG